MIGKHIELFLVDGTPGGLTTAEIIRWTGHVVRGERVQLGDFLKREEANRNGVYILLGDDDTAPTGTRAYIGRSENIAQRLRNHAANKEFWDRFVVITTKDDTFTEGHWGYLEARLVAIAKEADRATLTNDNSPQGRKLSEAQSSDMEAFILQLQIILPVLGVSRARTVPGSVFAARVIRSARARPEVSSSCRRVHASAGGTSIERSHEPRTSSSATSVGLSPAFLRPVRAARATNRTLPVLSGARGRDSDLSLPRHLSAQAEQVRRVEPSRPNPRPG